VKLSQILKSYRLTAGQVIAELFGGLIVNGPLSATGDFAPTSITRTGREAEPLTVVAYSAAPIVDLSLGNQFVMSIADAVAFVFGAPTNPPAVGQVWAITARNTSGGAHGAGTFNAIFKTVAVPFPAIATGFSRTIWFRWNGVNHVEIGRSAADVAN